MADSMNELREHKVIVQNQIRDLINGYEKLFNVEITGVELIKVESNIESKNHLVKVSLGIKIND